MTNGGLLPAGNAALAMNLAGNRPRLVWYAPDHIEGEMSSPSSLSDLIPENVHWTIWQLWLVVLLVALWKAGGSVTGGRGVTRCDPRVGDCRGSRSVVPIPSGA